MLCPPLGYESIQCYHTLRVLAQQLARAGFHVLRIDYDGTGESLGSDEDPSRLRAWLDSIAGAAHALSSLDGVEAVGLVGVRMGATLAARAASEVEGIAGLVLWEACPSGAAYTRELEILASATASLLGSAVEGGRTEGGSGATAVDASDGSADGITAAGYRVTAETRRDLEALTLTKVVPKGHPAVLVVERDDRPSNGAFAKHFGGLGLDTSVARLPGHKEMMVEPVRSRVPQAILDRIVAWAVERSVATSATATAAAATATGPAAASTAGGPAAGPGTPLLQPEAGEGGVVTRPVRLGPRKRLFGILTEPSRADPSRPAVLFVAGGVVPRTAVNRMYVTAARRLASLGHRVLRLDVSGIGESDPEPGRLPGDAYTQCLVPDVVGAVAWLGDDSVHLVGLCSGAYAAFQVALHEPRAKGLVLINPIVFHGAEGMSRDSTQVQQVQAASQYKRSLLDASKWKKLISGQVDVRYAMGVVTARARTWAGARAGRGVPADLRRMLAAGVCVGLAFSEGDPGVVAFTSQVGSRLDDLRARGLAVETFRGADHTFNPLGPREKLLDWIVERISTPSSSP